MILVNTPDMNISGILGTYYSLGVLVTAVFSLILGSFILIKGYKEKVKRYFFGIALFVFLWAGFIYLYSIARDYDQVLFLNRIANYAAIFMGACFVLFTEEYVKRENRIVSRIAISLALVMFVLCLLFPAAFIPSQSPKVHFKYYPDSGGLLFLSYFLFFSFSAMYSLFLSYCYYKKAEGIVKKQTYLIFLGLFISVTGGSTNFLPIFNIPLFPFGSSFALIYIIFTFYAIIRYRAMEIDTVIHRTVLWLLSILIMMLPLGLMYGLLRHEVLLLRPWYTAVFISLTLLFFLWGYNWLKPRIDHFFRRRKYDYQMVLAEMPARIGSSLDLDVLSQNLFRELKEVLYMRNGLLLIRSLEKAEFEEYSSLGYETLVQQGFYKPDSTRLALQNELVLWLSLHQQALEKEQVALDPQYHSIRDEAARFFEGHFLELLIPIFMQNQLIGLLGLGKKENLQSYRVRDIELLEQIGKQIGITMDNALHHEDIVEKERIAEELRLGRQIQMSLLPQSPPQMDHLSIHGFMQPAREIGGDYYDFIRLEDKDDLGIIIGDVSGKGVAAGLLMAMVKIAIHIFAAQENSPKQILLNINEILDRHIGGEKFMTLLYLIWQARRTSLRYSSAGHEYILLYRKDKDEVVEILSGGIILGVVPDIEKIIEEKDIALRPGDKILLYTDGITSAQNKEKDRFGLERLKDSFQRHSRKNAREIMEAVKDEVYEFIGSWPQYDDITLVVLETQG